MIAINGRILENRFTTAQWSAITDILPNRVFGYEVDVNGHPVGTKMGNGINLWSDLDYWDGGGACFQLKAIASNTIKAILAGSFITYILIIKETGTPSINIGLTSGGGEILPTIAVGIEQVMVHNTRYRIDTNLYFNISGGGSVNIYIYYLPNIL
jgi:hypothetical protein